jgi:phosphoribosylformylglycinamidine synthase
MGNYYADNETLARLEGEGRVVFRYCNESGEIITEANPNGSLNNIAGICDKSGRIVGMMPHPERRINRFLGGEDGKLLFNSMAQMFMEI